MREAMWSQALPEMIERFDCHYEESAALSAGNGREVKLFVLFANKFIC
jgi:hypothetical protein